jgi:hypothetical protein
MAGYITPMLLDSMLSVGLTLLVCGAALWLGGYLMGGNHD